MIVLENVTKYYSKKDKPAVDNVDLTVNDGEILGLVGLNGAGKTTAIRMVAGIISPSHGRITVDGVDVVEDKASASRLTGWVPETPNVDLNARAISLMRYFAGFYGFKGDETKRIIEERLGSVGLTDYAKRKLKVYSQGMKKRFLLAESLLGDPQNILFDETLNGLDPEGVKFVRDMIVKLKDDGRAILLSSHILSEIENIADRVAVIHRGKLIKLLSREEMKKIRSESLKIIVRNHDKNLLSLLEEFGEPDISGNELILKKLKIPYGEYSHIVKALVEGGYELETFCPTGESLESYFFSLVGVKK